MADKTATVVDAPVIVTVKVDNLEFRGLAVLKGTQIEVDIETARWMLEQQLIEG